MPFARPTFSDLQDQVAADIEAALPGSDAHLRFTVLAALAKAMSGLAFEHYGYLDWVSLQAVPYTAEGEYLEAWGALKAVYRKAATAASGKIVFTGAAGATLPSGQSLIAGDGTTFGSTSGGVMTGGKLEVTAVADVPGAAGNLAVGTAVSLSLAIAGVQSAGSVSVLFSGGADQESDDDLRTRVIEAFQAQAQGGSGSDYIRWAKEVAGVTRAWCGASGFGPGTVIVYFMMDDVQASHQGFPQGTNGMAAAETRSGTKAVGDQKVVADALFPLQPVTAQVYACAPIANPIAFTFTGLGSSTTATRTAINSAIDDVFFRTGAPGGTVNMSDVESAIAAVPGTAGFVLSTPTANIVSAAGYLPVRGAVLYV